MAHFTKLDGNNKVIAIFRISNDEIIDENGIEVEELGIVKCKELFGEEFEYKQTSYANNFRFRYAGLGYTYDKIRDAFIPPKPFESWYLNETTLDWDPPVAKPDDGKNYLWKEETQSWFQLNCPYPSWSFNNETWEFISPVPKPDDGQEYTWNEETQSWDLIQP